MSTIKILLISFLILGFSKRQVTSAEPCPEINAKATIQHTTNGLENGQVTLKLDDKEPYTVFLFGPDENRLSLKTYEISDLKVGEYNIVVQNKKGCTKRLVIKIN